MELNTVEHVIRKLLEAVQDIRSYTARTEELKELLYTKVEYGSKHLGGYALRVVIDVEFRSYRRLDEVSKCTDTDITFNKIILMCDYSRCTLSLARNERVVFSMEDFHAYISPIHLMTLACNITPEDLDKIIESIKDKCKEVDDAIELVKQILAMVKVLTAGRDK